MKALVIFASLVLTLSASSQKSVTNPPGVLLHGDAVLGYGQRYGQPGSLRVILTGGDGEPASHVGVEVLWLCPKGCQFVESSMLTDSVGEFRLDPITVGKYLVCSNSNVDSKLPCFSDVAATSCTVDITPEYPEVELHMQVSKSGIASPKSHEQGRCRQSHQKATSSH